MHDEIISEVYRIRDSLSEKYHHNLDEIVERIREREKKPFGKLRTKRKSKPKKRESGGFRI